MPVKLATSKRLEKIKSNISEKRNIKDIVFKHGVAADTLSQKRNLMKSVEIDHRFKLVRFSLAKEFKSNKEISNSINEFSNKIDLIKKTYSEDMYRNHIKFKHIRFLDKQYTGELIKIFRENTDPKLIAHLIEMLNKTYIKEIDRHLKKIEEK